jgi:hypothetical protein
MTTLKSKVSVQLFGGSQIKSQPENVRQMVLGVIGGVATGLFAAKAQDGVTDIWGLKGTFYAQILRKDDNGATIVETVESGKCYLPEAFQTPIEDMFQGDPAETDPETGKVTKWNREPIKSIEFAYKVIVSRATNKAGYTWSFQPLKEAGANDPLAAAKSEALAALGFENNTKQLEAPAKGKGK